MYLLKSWSKYLTTFILIIIGICGTASTQVSRYKNELVSPLPTMMPVVGTVFSAPYTMVGYSDGGFIVAGDLRGELRGLDSLLDGFVSRTDSYGKLQWSVRIGTPLTQDRIFSLAMDTEGNIYAGGSTFGSFDASPNIGQTDGFLIKLSPNGQVIWMRQFGSEKGEDVSNILIDKNGQVVVLGVTNGVFAGQNANSYDTYLMKLDSNGNHLWTRLSGLPEFDIHRGAVIDKAEEIYTAGQIDNVSSRTQAGLISKFDINGKILWSRKYPTTGYGDVRFRWLNLDPNNNLLVAAEIYGSFQSVESDSYSAMVTKLDPQGNVIWTSGLGADGRIYSQIVDQIGNSYMVGSTRANLSDPKSSDINSYNAYIASFSESGRLRWTRQFSDSNSDIQALAVVLTKSNQLAVLIDNWTSGTWKIILLDQNGRSL